MRVFVTGATGFIGTAIVRELLDAGHQVLGLSRSDKDATSLAAAGAEPHRGNLDDLDSLRSGAIASDSVIHNAFNNDFSAYVAAAQQDRRAIESLGTALTGSGKPFVVTSVTFGRSPGRLATEEDVPDPVAPAALRIPSEQAALSFAKLGVRVSVLRLAPSVHGRGDHQFVPGLISVARATGVSAYQGDGSCRWPAVHLLDAAHLFRLVLEAAPTGARLHGVSDEGVRIRDIAEVIGRHLGLPVTAISREEANRHFGWLGPLVSLDSPASSLLTQKQMGWHPVQPALISDLEEGHYFNE